VSCHVCGHQTNTRPQKGLGQVLLMLRVDLKSLMPKMEWQLQLSQLSKACQLCCNCLQLISTQDPQHCTASNCVSPSTRVC